MNETDPEQLRLFAISLINSAYQLNQKIPNIELMFYRVFCSPITTKDIRQGNKDLLAGNIFAKQGINLGSQVYRSLLETVALHPKKKHYKKIVQHMLQYEDKENVDPELLQLMIFVGIDQKYPILLGQTMKYLLQNDYQVTPKIFKQFMSFLERCKGYEEDAKKFVVLTADTTSVQVDYDLLRPMFIRTIKNKTGNDVLKLFEQFRKQLKLNKSHAKMTPEQRSLTFQKVKCDIYDGLVKDLLAVKAYALCQVIYSEKMREKFPMTIDDHITGLEIYAVQKKLTEYQTRFKEVLNSTEFPVTQKTCEELGRTLQYFTGEDQKQARVLMTEQLYHKITVNEIMMTGQLFDSLVYVFTESQMWSKVNSMLSTASSRNCEPEVKTVEFLKKNLVYCFDPNLRSSLKDNIGLFEMEFFHGKKQEPQKQKQTRAPRK